MPMSSPSSSSPPNAFSSDLETFAERSRLLLSLPGPEQRARLAEQGKQSARERIASLLDKGSRFQEIGLFAGWEMYQEHGGCPGGGIVGGLGTIEGRLCVVVANDPTVKAGAWFPITAKKHLRLQEIAMENRLPVVYLVDSAGVYLPLQDEIFPDKEHFGRVFRNNARLSAKGIPQIAAVLGSCVAGGAYLPIMSDETLMVEPQGSIFLAGPFLVKAAIGEQVDAQTLGGAWTHNALSGIADYRFSDEASCLKELRRLIGHLGAAPRAGLDRREPLDPLQDPEGLRSVIPPDPTRPYDMMELISRLVDGSRLEAFKNDYGKTILCGYARIDGWSVGIVANQRLMTKSARGEVQLGGVIYNDSADKAARFIMNCNQKKVPLLFLQDVTGFMVGSRSEQSGIIKDGAKMVNAVANSTVPKLTLLVGNSYGAGNYAMCGKAYDPRFIAAWPSARVAVMGGEQAARTLLQLQLSGLRKQGKEPSETEQQALLEDIRSRYELQSSPYYAAARLWVDALIDPADTRNWVSGCLEAANHAPFEGGFHPGLIQV